MHLLRNTSRALVLALLSLLLTGCDAKTVVQTILVVIVVIIVIVLIILALPEEIVGGFLLWLEWLLLDVIWPWLVWLFGEVIWPWLRWLFADIIWPWLEWLFADIIWPWLEWLLLDVIWPWLAWLFGVVRNFWWVRIWPWMKWLWAFAGGNALWDLIQYGWKWLWSGTPGTYYPPRIVACGSTVTLISPQTGTDTETDYPLGKTAVQVSNDAAVAANTNAQNAATADLLAQMNAITCVAPCTGVIVVNGPTFFVTA